VTEKKKNFTRRKKAERDLRDMEKGGSFGMRKGKRKEKGSSTAVGGSASKKRRVGGFPIPKNPPDAKRVKKQGEKCAEKKKKSITFQESTDL